MSRTLRRQDAAPLDTFSPEHRARIQAAVEQPTPPPRYFYVGFRDDPRPLGMMESRAWWEWHWQRGIDPDKRRPSLAPWRRRTVIKRDGYVCGLCGGDVEPTDVHIDHIYPWSLGGSDHLDNLQVTHSRCNIEKGARTCSG